MPHCRIEGGAGLYIQDVISLLKRYTRVRLAGRYSEEYIFPSLRSTILDTLAASSFPTYDGIRKAATLYHLLRSLGLFFLLLVKSTYRRRVPDVSVLMFTSSIQAIAVPIARLFFPRSRIVVVVQEQVDLSRGFGRVTSVLLRRCNVVVAITESWARHASRFGVHTVVLKNSFDPKFADPDHNIEPAIPSDILYVGGGAPIKGFDNLTDALPHILKSPGRRVICLGHYNDTARSTLERIKADAPQNDQLVIVGLEKDIRPYLRGTRLLLLPIGNPHFCRPAIEAGLFRKTFLIPDLPSLEDFTTAGQNCEMYPVGDTQALLEAIDLVLDNCERRASLGHENWKLAQKFLPKNEEEIAFLNALSGACCDAAP